MLYLARWTIQPDHRDKSIRRFSEAGAPPPSGVKVIGRWHTIDQSGGLVIAETDDPLDMGRWCMEWSDVFHFDITPVVDDAGMQKILGR